MTWDRIRTCLLGAWSGVALLYLFIPIFIVVLFSFNDNQGRFNFTWQGFTLKPLGAPVRRPGPRAGAEELAADRRRSSTAIATALGTFMALALVRYGFRGRGAADLFVFLPLATPEVVLGAALLALFLTMNVATGFATIVIAHVMFNISYVVVTVKARLEGHGRAHRGGGAGPRRGRLDDVPARDAADDRARRRVRRAARRSRCRSTTT